MTATGNKPSKPVPISRHIQIHIHSVDLAFPVNPPSKPSRAYVRVRITGRKGGTKTGLYLGQIHLASWQADLPPLALEDASEMTFDLRHRPLKVGSSQIAETSSYSLSQLLQMQGTGADFSLPLCAKQSGSAKLGTLRVAVRVLSSVDAAKISLDSAQNSLSVFLPKTISAKHAARYRAGYQALAPICGILDIVGAFVTFSPEPITCTVIGIVRGAAKSVKEQIEQDEAVLTLIKKIDHIYFMVAGTAQLNAGRRDPVDKDMEAALIELVTALGDCTKFMLSFCKSSFLRRVSRTGKKTKELEELKERMHKTSDDLHRLLQLDMLRANAKLAELVEKTYADVELEKLARVEMDTHHRPKCTSAAHATTLETVKLWATSPLPDGDSKNIYWLRGSKSAAAVITSLWYDLHEDQLLGNFFFRKRRKGLPRRDPALLVQTLAAQLGDSRDSDALKLLMAQSLKDNPSVLKESVEEQFEQLLVQPLVAYASDRSVVFLFDKYGFGPERRQPAEEEDSAEREMMKRVLRLLVQGSARFPPNVRLVIGGRDDEDLSDVMEGCVRVVELEMPPEEVELESTKQRNVW
ncbi:hypothetical protein DFH08DRAFT_862300 [Mycena albidolilacea]|uniref:Uncharacterized protein n=1 Tax=Mycena albidolilacea TaxID=1033008 RepID=A0AAD7A6T0_9AGAR|nr:hypothetical protein DFH08DRAFT_862300 [Mycena albidolilacea]